MGTNYQKLHEKEYQNLYKEYQYLKETIKKNIEESTKTIEALTEKVDKLYEENKKLNSEVIRLKKQINKDSSSSNSSKPPSSNGFKKVIQNNRKATTKKPGGQKGHEGNFLEAVENPDVIIDHNNKCDCGHELENIEIKKKQEINIKIVKEITEHRYYEGYCPVCKKVHSNKIPDNLKNPINYGDSVKSLVALLISQGVVSINRTSEFLSLITNNSINISNGTISNWIKELAYKLGPVIDDITEKLLNSELLHVDESPIKVNGKQMYVHNASTENYVLQVPHEKKSIVAMQEIGLLPKYTGIIMSDHYKAYYNFGTSNAECNVHITRYLKNITETTSHKWAENFSNFLYNIKDEKEDIINKTGKEFNSDKLNYIYKEYDDILASGLKEYKSSEYKDDSERKLLNRLINYKENHLMFINNFMVPFSNNEAEDLLEE